MKLALHATVSMLLLGCSQGPIVDLAPDDERTGLSGSDGPYGVAHQTFTINARVTDRIRYEVSWPATQDGGFHPDAGSCALVMFVHGGLVHADQYRWLQRHFASRGYCVISPEHDLNLAIMESDNASLVLDHLQDRPPEPLAGVLGEDAVIMGHSLGGAVASFRWVADERFLGLGLLASYPADATPVEDQAGRPSISIIGSEDGGDSAQIAYDAYRRFVDPKWFGVVDGMNHYDWADGATDQNLASDGVPTRPQAQTRLQSLTVLDAWLDAWLRQEADAKAALDAHAFPGVRKAP